MRQVDDSPARSQSTANETWTLRRVLPTPRARTWRRSMRQAFTLLSVALLCACGGGDGGTGPLQAEEGRLQFAQASLQLGLSRQTSLSLRNVGTGELTSVTVVPGEVRDPQGTAAAGARVTAFPSSIPRLSPGGSATIQLSIELPDDLDAGSYSTSIEARAAGSPSASAQLALEVPVREANDRTVTITAGPANIRQGEPAGYAAEVRLNGELLTGLTIQWSVQPPDAGFVADDGRFVGYGPGTAELVARVGSTLSNPHPVTIEARNGPTGTFSVAGRIRQANHFTSDLWVHGATAYTGTFGCRAGTCGNTLYTWDVSDPAAPGLSSQLAVDAVTVNDVKVRDDGGLAVITHEGSTDGMNGVTLLDTSDPGRPAVLTRYTTNLQAGVHNVWLDGDHLYVIDDAGPLRILDISTPTAPVEVASFFDGEGLGFEGLTHDVYVRDGLAFLSHWDVGLVILDVGNGVAGGSPVAPVEVGRTTTVGGDTHNAWYWPEAGYVFVGEEDFVQPYGSMHVIDVRDLSNPQEVASFTVPGATPHNFWMDETRGVLYMGWYENGLRALDVTGELLGALDRQDREIAFSLYDGAGVCEPAVEDGTCTWAPQLHDGLIYLADMQTGLWILRPDF